MEALEEGSKTTKGFIKHVFNFDDDSKGDMMNIIQYAVLSLIPIVALNKTMQRFVPEADEQKGHLEIVVEILLQVIGMFLGILLIHRIVTYIPTYSGAKYPEFNIVFIILAVLMITLSLQTKLGEKVSILSDRIIDLWEGKKEAPKKGKQVAVKVSQPISQPPPIGGGYSDGTSIHSLPPTDYALSAGAQQGPRQQQPNYNEMHRADTNPLVGAASPGYENFQQGGIMAANEALGGSGFGSSW